MQPRQDLQVLLLVDVLPVASDLGADPRALLLRLADLDPLLSREVLSELGERIGGKAQTVQQGAVLDRVEDHVVVRAREVQDAQAVDVRLVRGRRVHAVHAGLDQPARQRSQRVARVDRDGAVLRLDPLPLARRVLDLQRRYRLSEQQRHRAKVRVPRPVQVADQLVLLGAPRRVVHVAQMVLPLYIVQMVPD